MPVEYPQINGHVPDWSSCEWKFNGQIYTRFKSMNYSDNIDAIMTRGNNPEPDGETRGEYKAQADCEIYIDEFKRLKADLGDGWREVRFFVTCAYRDGVMPVETDELIGVRILGVDASQSQGTDALVRKLTLSLFKVKWGGFENLFAPLTGIGV